MAAEDFDRRSDGAGGGTYRMDVEAKVHAESIEANSVHGSDSPENAATEVAYFFPTVDLHTR